MSLVSTNGDPLPTYRWRPLGRDSVIRFELVQTNSEAKLTDPIQLLTPAQNPHMANRSSVGSPSNRLREAAKQLEIASDQLKTCEAELSEELHRTAEQVRELAEQYPNSS